MNNQKIYLNKKGLGSTKSVKPYDGQRGKHLSLDMDVNLIR